MKNWIQAATVAAVMSMSLAAGAETLDEAKTLQDAAIAEVKAKGLDAAVKEFNTGGKWRKGSLYIVIANFSGDMLAHSANEKIIGKNMLEAKDAGGKAFVKDAIAGVKGSGSAQFDIRWANPVTKQIADATFLTRRLPGNDAYIGTVVFK
ncbi:MAG: cache domain-containing protein [Rubrivivax sp.]|nr:cache domain-containing protein [Rubrivivax sp.]